MAVLSVFLLSLFFSIFCDELEPVGAPIPGGANYDCASLNPTGANPTPEQYATARTGCIATGWCLWVISSKTCILDPCLKWIADDGVLATECPSSVSGVSCGAYYQTDEHNCGTFNSPGSGAVIGTPHDVYCRVKSDDVSHERSVIDSCFYADLKARAQTGGSPTCGARPCAWTGTSATDSPGRYCSASDADVCTNYWGDWNKFCGCLGGEEGGKYCNLHPKCMYTSGKCIEDACTRATGGPAGSACTNFPVDADPTECLSRYEQTLNSNTGALSGPTGYCANIKKNNNSNNCFNALVTIVRNWQTTDGEYWADCTDSTTYDHCTEAFDYDYTDTTPPGGGVKKEACVVADIPAGWFPGTKICINSGRPTPPVDRATNSIRVSSLVVLLICAAFALVL